MKKKTLLVALLVLLSGLAFASDEVSIVVSSDGATKDEAIKMALRSAIEQTFGAFVSSNTTVLNDQLVNDEIVSLSNGNVKSYEILTENTLPDNRFYVTLRATICMNKLVNYINSNSKSTAVEVNMDAFDKNIRLAEMNKNAERKIVESVISQIEQMENLFDCSLELDEPRVYGENEYLIEGIELFYYNKNTDIAVNLLKNTLKEINMSREEIEQYEKMGLYYYSTPQYTRSHRDLNNVNVTEYWCAEPLIGEQLCLRSAYHNSFLDTNSKGSTGSDHIVSSKLLDDKMKEYQIGDNVSFPSKLKIYQDDGICFSSLWRGKNYKVGCSRYYKEVVYNVSRLFGVHHCRTYPYKNRDLIGIRHIRIIVPKNESSKYKSFNIQPGSGRKKQLVK